MGDVTHIPTVSRYSTEVINTNCIKAFISLPNSTTLTVRQEHRSAGWMDELLFVHKELTNLCISMFFGKDSDAITDSYSDTLDLCLHSHTFV